MFLLNCLFLNPFTLEWLLLLVRSYETPSAHMISIIIYRKITFLYIPSQIKT